jgi:O-antigen ligase
MIHIYGRVSLIGKLRYYFLDRNYNRTIRFAFIFMCLGMTLLSTLMFSGPDEGISSVLGLMPIVAIVGIAGLIFIYTHMEAFALLVLAVTMLLNDGISTGSGTKATFTFVLLCIWLFIWFFKMIVVERKWDIRHTPANIPILLFIIVTVISLIWSSLYPEPAVRYLLDSKLAPRLMTTMVLIISPLTFLLYGNHLRSMGSIRILTWWFIGIGAVFLVLRLALGIVPSPLNSRGQFPTWVGVIALSQFLFNRNLPTWLRWALPVILVGWLYIVIDLGIAWLSGWLPLLVGIAVVVFFYSRRLAIMIVVVAASYFLLNFNTYQANFARESEESGGTRSEAWQRVFDLTENHYLFGTGPAGYNFYFTIYISGLYQLAHNNYVDIIGQTGYIGFAVWMLLWGAIGITIWRLYRVMPLMKTGFEKGLTIALVASYFCTLVSMALGDWVTPFPYTQTLQGIDYTIWAWILPGVATALYYLTIEKADQTSYDLQVETEMLPDNLSSGKQVPLLPSSTSQ